MCCNNGNNPVGTVNYFARQFPPEGWLLCDGREVSRDVFADLFNMLGTSFGKGDGKITFNLPDLRGEFIRGLDMGRGIDSNRGLGSSQADDFKSHFHGLLFGAKAGSVNAVVSNNDRLLDDVKYTYASGHGAYMTAEGGAETRPRNVALLACIKY